MAQNRLHKNQWQIERNNTLSLGYCFIAINSIVDNKPKEIGLKDIDLG
jgi:hypothetical protein